MIKCKSSCKCRQCPKHKTCPRKVRADKIARRPMSDSASIQLLRRAASILDSGWFSCSSLAEALYGKPKNNRSNRMSGMVRARRPLNRLLKLGVLAVRPLGIKGYEYTLLPDGKGLIG